MRALLYNWVQFDVSGEGGGVSVYLRETIPELVKAGWQVSVLSAGRAYDGFDRSCRHRETPNQLAGLGVRSFEIVNSPVKAPAHDSVAIIGECLDNPTIADAFVRVVEETGPYDVVVIHNIEGISTLTLERLRERTQAAVVLFAHNYHLVCPQIELLRDFADHCRDYHDGKDCIGCFGMIHDARGRKKERAIVDLMERMRIAGTPMETLARATAEHGLAWGRNAIAAGRALKQGGWRPKAPAGPPPGRWRQSMHALDGAIDNLAGWSAAFRRWRELNARRANACDGIVTVSGRARDQLCERGIDRTKVEVIHLGFEQHVPPAERLARFDAKSRRGGALRLGFFGYAIPSKGLHFLIEALEDAGPWTRQIELCIFCRYSDHLQRRLARLEGKLAAVRWIDGYSHAELPEILNFVDCGIIPSICYETYSITAYELTMAGVPVIMADSVGFGELVADPRFHFRRQDAASLRKTLAHLVKNRSELREYFSEPAPVPDLKDHMDRFLAYIQRAVAVRRGPVAAPSAETSVAEAAVGAQD